MPSNLGIGAESQRTIDLPDRQPDDSIEIAQSGDPHSRVDPSKETKLPSTFLTISRNRWKWLGHSVKPGELIHRIGTLGSGLSWGEGVGVGRGSTQGSRAMHRLAGMADKAGSSGGGVCSR